MRRLERGEQQPVPARGDAQPAADGPERIGALLLELPLPDQLQQALVREQAQVLLAHA
jgi:hypothetical protein